MRHVSDSRKKHSNISAQSAAILDELTKQVPANAYYQHQSMMTWAHVGDLLGLPSAPNLGDVPGAISAYEKAVELARHLYKVDDADERGVSDYGIALSRLAGVLPADQFVRRMSLLHEAIPLMEEAARRNPKSFQNKMFRAEAHKSAGRFADKCW